MEASTQQSVSALVRTLSDILPLPSGCGGASVIYLCGPVSLIHEHLSHVRYPPGSSRVITPDIPHPIGMILFPHRPQLGVLGTGHRRHHQGVAGQVSELYSRPGLSTWVHLAKEITIHDAITPFSLYIHPTYPVHGSCGTVGDGSTRPCNTRDMTNWGMPVGKTRLGSVDARGKTRPPLLVRPPRNTCWGGAYTRGHVPFFPPLFVASPSPGHLQVASRAPQREKKSCNFTARGCGRNIPLGTTYHPVRSRKWVPGKRVPVSMPMSFLSLIKRNSSFCIRGLGSKDSVPQKSLIDVPRPFLDRNQYHVHVLHACIGTNATHVGSSGSLGTYWMPE
ncbi:hypothetical protein JVT61DRAFT_14304 [Boletus reticuloceps]|uniref:Uncharacterized protein n=1 Tax=Boletus reticuloceps TaxID=495285 RepID=A0A8I2YCV3_9AGAM|nr:hypothetical protein JVT61DRAFT_14304 [Boletus reticuloceps]